MDIPKFWRQKRFLSYLLLPFSAIYYLIIAGKRFFRNREKTSIFTVIVGNLSVGGNGKTPLIIALANQLSASGLKVGVISRGYGRKNDELLEVFPESNPLFCGDEALLIKRKTAAKVAVAKKRTQARDYLDKKYNLDIILSDDGLQHYSLNRDYEIIVFAADFAFGNEFVLPAGALRESKNRLKSVNKVICMQSASEALPDVKINYELIKREAYLREFKSEKIIFPPDLNEQLENVVFCAIARPERFFRTVEALLQQFNLAISAFRYADDHAPIQADDLLFAQNKRLFITEKDAVKLDFPLPCAECIVVTEKLILPSDLISALLQAKNNHIKNNYQKGNNGN